MVKGWVCPTAISSGRYDGESSISTNVHIKGANKLGCKHPGNMKTQGSQSGVDPINEGKHGSEHQGKSVLGCWICWCATNRGTTLALAKGTAGIESASRAKRATTTQPEVLGMMRLGTGMRWHYERCQLSVARLLQMVLWLREGKCMVDLLPWKGEPKVDAPLQGSTKKCGLAGGEVVALKRACKANEKQAWTQCAAAREHEETWGQTGWE